MVIGLAALASAGTITFGLDGDPGQNYTFVPIGAPNGVTDTEPAGPYPGWLGQNIPADAGYFFCISFLKTATFGASYDGTITTPSTLEELEAAFLGADLVSLGGQNAPLAEKGAISMAIWQITDPTPGDVPRDPAAQPYVTAAQNAYATGNLSAADFPNTTIFVPDNTGIQTFMLAAAESLPGKSISGNELSATPEPTGIVLIVTGLCLICLSRIKMAKRATK